MLLTFQLLKSLLKVLGRFSVCLPHIDLVLEPFDFHIDLRHPRPVLFCVHARSTCNVRGFPLKRLTHEISASLLSRSWLCEGHTARSSKIRDVAQRRMMRPSAFLYQ